MNSINTVNGVLVAAQSDFAGHVEDKMIHLAEEERTAWNEAAAIPEASNTFTGDNIHSGTETFDSIVNINHDIITNGKSLNLFLYQQALL